MAIQPRMQTPPRRRINALCSVSSIALIAVLGPRGGMGKTSIADVLRSYCEAADLPIRTIRVETGVRQGEFGPQDIVIDLDSAAEAAIGLGGEAALFEPAWPTFEAAMAGRNIAIVDGGANAHNAILGMAGLTSLGRQIADAGRRTIVFVATTPDAETARQASALVQDVRERVPEAIVVLAVNYLNPAERAGVDTPQAREFNTVLRGLGDIPRLVLPFARGQSLPAFARAGSFLRVIRAPEAELMALTGAGKLATGAARAYFSAWWLNAAHQLEQLFPVR